MQIFKISQLGKMPVKIIVRGNGSNRTVEIINNGTLTPKQCDKIREYYESLGEPEKVLSESKHSGVEEKMLAPLEEEQEAAPALEKQQEKF